MVDRPVEPADAAAWDAEVARVTAAYEARARAVDQLSSTDRRALLYMIASCYPDAFDTAAGALLRPPLHPYEDGRAAALIPMLREIGPGR